MADRPLLNAKDLIAKLGLIPLPEEGGYYRETYRSAGRWPANSTDERAFSTCIYYLLTHDSFSALHRLKTTDEIFHFYAGDPADMIRIDPDGSLRKDVFGNDIAAGQTPQIVVSAGVWQALRLQDGGRWALIGTTVAPGFEFDDFETGDRETMLRLFPSQKTEIFRFTRASGDSPHPS